MAMHRSFKADLISDEIRAKAIPYPSGRRLNRGAGGEVWEVDGSPESVIKISQNTIGGLVEGLVHIAKKEIEALKRLYPNEIIEMVYVRHREDPDSLHIGIRMPRLHGKGLDEIKQEELSRLSFSQRVKLALQVVEGYKKLHYPKFRGEPVIINPDNHGGNIMVDLDTLQVHLFDFDKCIFLPKGQREVVLANLDGQNEISMSPETASDKRVSILSDSYGLVAQEIFLLGALQPAKHKLSPNQKKMLSHSYKEKLSSDAIEVQQGRKTLLDAVTKYNARVGFDYTGFLRIEGIPTLPEFPLPMEELLRAFYQRRVERDLAKRASTLEGARFLTIVDAVCTRLESKEIKEAKKEVIPTTDLFQAAELILLCAGLWQENCMSKWNVNLCNFIIDAYMQQQQQRYVSWNEMNGSDSEDDELGDSFIGSLKHRMHSLSDDDFNVFASPLIKNQKVAFDIGQVNRLNSDNFNACVHYLVENRQISVDEMLLKGKENLKISSPDHQLEAKKWFQAAKYYGSEEAERQLFLMKEQISSSALTMRALNGSCVNVAEQNRDLDLENKLGENKHSELKRELPPKLSPFGHFVENLERYRIMRKREGDYRVVTFFKEVFGIFTEAQKIATVGKIITICLDYREKMIRYRQSNGQSEVKHINQPVFDFTSLTLQDYDILRDGRVGVMIEAYKNADSAFAEGFNAQERDLNSQKLIRLNEALENLGISRISHTPCNKE